MVEANPPENGNRHVVKRSNLPQIDERILLDKAKFDREEILTAVKVPVTQIQEFTKNVSLIARSMISEESV